MFFTHQKIVEPITSSSALDGYQLMRMVGLRPGHPFVIVEIWSNHETLDPVEQFTHLLVEIGAAFLLLEDGVKKVKINSAHLFTSKYSESGATWTNRKVKKTYKVGKHIEYPDHDGLVGVWVFEDGTEMAFEIPSA